MQRRLHGDHGARRRSFGEHPDERGRIYGRRGGYSTAALSFYVEYQPLGPPSPTGTLFDVVLHANDVFSRNFASYGKYVADAQAYIAVGVAGNVPGVLHNFQSYTFQDTDCVNG
jgi:hypothetical protein